MLSTQPKRFPSFLEKFYIKDIMSCRLLVSALMLSFKQNFLDWLLGRQPNVRALGGQAAPLRSKASLSRLAGASRGQLSPSSRASPPSACSAHPPGPAPPLLPAVSRWAPAAPRGKVQRRSSKVRNPVCLLPPSTASLPLLLSCSGCTGLSRTGCLAITRGPSWLLHGKSRRLLLLDRPARPCSGLNTGKLSLQDPKGCLSTRSEGS